MNKNNLFKISVSIVTVSILVILWRFTDIVTFFVLTLSTSIFIVTKEYFGKKDDNDEQLNPKEELLKLKKNKERR
jgi:hypothetical protein